MMAVLLTLSGRAQAQYPWTDFPGNPPITPRWAFEPWVWDGNSQVTAAATNLVNGYMTNNIPVGAVIIDDPWFTSYMDFNWNTAQYANPTNMIQNFRAEGVRVICWMVGMVNNTSKHNPPPLGQHPGYSFATNNNFGINNNTPYSWWQGSGLGVDFSNTNAVNWFMGQASNLIAMGVSGLKVDQSDIYASDPVVTSPGSVFGVTNLPRGQYSEYYYAAISDWVLAQTNDAITFARPSSYQLTTGSNKGYEAPPSKLITGWCGDFPGDFPGFIMQLTNVYTSAASGYSSIGFEIGGYTGNDPTHDSLLRQVEFASLLPVMENGGANGGETEHQPWYWNAHGYTDAISTYQYYATLHHNLAPFEFDLSVNASLTGQPAVTQVSQSQYWHILGNSLLTWAVTSASVNSSNSLTLNFPDTTNLWVNWWNPSQTFYGGTLTNLSYSVDTAPIFVRAGSIIPVNVDSSVTGLGDTNSTGKNTILMFPDGTNQLVYYRPLGNGIAYENDTIAVAEGTNGYVQVDSPASQSWIFKIISFAAPTNVAVSGIPGAYTNYTYNSAENLLTLSVTGAVFTVSISPLPGYATLVQPPPVTVVPPAAAIVDPTAGTIFLSSTNETLLLSATASNTVPTNIMTTIWSQAGGPGIVTFGNSNALTTTASFSAEGIYGLTFTADNGAATNVSLTVAVNTTIEVVTNGLLGWWKMDETGGTTAFDSSTNGRNATVSGATFTNGYLGNALDLTGGTNNASFTSADAPQTTVAAWVLANSTGKFPYILGAPGYHIIFRFDGTTNNDTLDFATVTTSNGTVVNGEWLTPSNSINTGGWYHVAVSYDKSSTTNVPALYVNGVNMPLTPLTTPTVATPSYAGTTYIGNRQDLTRGWKGLIDDLRIYNRLLSGAEVQTLASETPPNLAPVVNAGGNQTIVLPASANLNGSVSDDGLPNPPGYVTVTWSEVSGPGTVTFADSNAPATTANFSAAGGYQLQLAASDGQVTTVSSATVAAIAAPPHIGNVSVSGGNVILGGTGGIANGTYYVLTSTNIAAPLAGWTRLLTNQFDGAGNFNVTNTMNSNAPQSFYLLQLP